MLGTPTAREGVSLLPRVHSVAVSMEGLQVGSARLVSIATDVLNRELVILVEAPPTLATAPPWLFQPLRQAWTDVRVPSRSCAPVHPSASIGTAMALDLHMPRHRPRTLGREGDGVRPSGWGGEATTGVEPMPVPLPHPPDGRGRVSSLCPAAERDPRAGSKPRIPGCAHADAVIVGPPGCGGCADGCGRSGARPSSGA
jgi:hypothetical protein